MSLVFWDLMRLPPLVPLLVLPVFLCPGWPWENPSSDSQADKTGWSQCHPWTVGHIAFRNRRRPPYLQRIVVENPPLSTSCPQEEQNYFELVRYNQYYSYPHSELQVVHYNGWDERIQGLEDRVG